MTYSQQMWCTYALHIATFTSLAFVMDPFIILALWKGTADWDPENRRIAFWAQIAFVFGFTKTQNLATN
ncbi:Type 2 glycosyltransferase like protein [Verticillium longisporum]|nr:Type 2 glycosyltransferase like protein [Verticillium longisporum]